MLCKLLSIKDGKFPDLEKQLTFFENSFDGVQAKAEGVIIPNQGVNCKYDSSQEEVNSMLNELDQYLTQQKRRLNCKVSQNYKYGCPSFVSTCRTSLTGVLGGTDFKWKSLYHLYLITSKITN